MGKIAAIQRKPLKIHHRMMNRTLTKHLTVLGLEVAALFSLASPLLAEPVLERVARTGVLTAGTRTDSAPLAFQTPEGEWVGYSIDLLERLRGELERELGRSVELQLTAVEVVDRFDRVAAGDLDLACGATSVTAGRGRDIDFSISYFVTGTQVLTRRSGDITGNTLRIGVIPHTTNLYFIEDRFPIARFIEVANRAEGLEALESGRIDGFASDGILLEGMRQLTADPNAYIVYPSRPLNEEVYACILPEGDFEFQRFVNQVLISEMRQIVAGDRLAAERFNRWFGEAGMTPINTTDLLQYFRDTIATYDADSADAAAPAPEDATGDRSDN